MCNVGKRIRDRRIELGYSAEELAPMVGLSPATIYRYENGDIKKVSINKVRPIAAALKTTEAYLMGWTDNVAVVEEVAEVVDEPTLSARALEIAKAYDKMSSYGKSLIDKIVENEGRYKIMKVIPMVGDALLDGTVETKHAAKQELQELSAEELAQKPSRILR